MVSKAHGTSSHSRPQRWEILDQGQTALRSLESIVQIVYISFGIILHCSIDVSDARSSRATRSLVASEVETAINKDDTVLVLAGAEADTIPDSPVLSHEIRINGSCKHGSQDFTLVTLQDNSNRRESRSLTAKGHCVISGKEKMTLPCAWPVCFV